MVWRTESAPRDVRIAWKRASRMNTTMSPEASVRMKLPMMMRSSRRRTSMRALVKVTPGRRSMISPKRTGM